MKRNFVLSVLFLLFTTLSAFAQVSFEKGRSELPFSAYQPSYDKKLNFGVLVNNGDYQIYRSSYLDEKKMEELYEHLWDFNLPYPKTVIYMNRHGYGGWASVWRKNALEEYEESYKYGFDFFHPFRYDYRTYVEGKNPYYPEDDIDQEKYVNSKSKSYFGLQKDNKLDGGVDAFIRVMELVLDPARQPVVFHCYGGRHRTGMIGMMIRYIQGGEWTDDSTTVEKTIDGKTMKLNAAEYEYYLHNSDQMRGANIEFIREFVATEPIFKEWQEKYQEELNRK